MQATIIFADLARVLVVLAGTILAGINYLAVWHRIRDRNSWRTPPHPARAASVAIVMTLLIARRLDNLGEPADTWLFAAGTAVAIGLYGVSRDYHIHVLPPWLRRTRTAADDAAEISTRH